MRSRAGKDPTLVALSKSMSTECTKLDALRSVVGEQGAEKTADKNRHGHVFAIFERNPLFAVGSGNSLHLAC